jgi:hypothetical protein
MALESFDNSPYVFHQELRQHPKRGRKPRIEEEELLQDRDSLIDFLEIRWPELTLLLRNPANKKEEFVAVFRSHPFISGEFSSRTRDQEHLWRYAEELWDFLVSGRYHGDPRQIANAMAGVPMLSWRRSFDLCGQSPSSLPIYVQAMRDYLRRRFSDRFRELLTAGTPAEAHKIIKRARSDDRLIKQLKRQPDLLWQALTVGRHSRDRN